MTALGPAAARAAAWTACAALAIAAFARHAGRPLWRSDMAILLPLYPVYGVAQQIVFQGVLHRRLAALLGRGVAPVLLTAFAFAAVHLPDLPLCAATFAAGLVWSAIWRASPNAIPLGLSHGFLASLAYPLLLADDPLGRF